MATMVLTLTRDVVIEEAGEAREWVDTQAAAAAIMERLEERVAALQLIEALGDDGISIERVTESGTVGFTVRCDGLKVASARAARVVADGGAWLVLSESVAGRSRHAPGSASAATCFAAVLLLAASEVRARTGLAVAA